MLRALLFLAGAASVIAGLALWLLPVALVVGGVAVCGMAFHLELETQRKAKRDRPL